MFEDEEQPTMAPDNCWTASGKKLRDPKNYAARAGVASCLSASFFSGTTVITLKALGLPMAMACVSGFSAFVSAGCLASVACCLICKHTPCCCVSTEDERKEEGPIYPHLMAKNN